VTRRDVSQNAALENVFQALYQSGLLHGSFVFLFNKQRQRISFAGDKCMISTF
jgi:hypothetical protein